MTPAPASVEERLRRLEAESAVRGVVARYMALCDTLGPDTPLDALAALFTRDAEWIGTGARHAAAFGRHAGREAIVAMLATYRGPPAHFAFNAHYLTSEHIVVDGERAEGGWAMLQCSTYADGRSDLRSARLRVAFALEADDAWRIARFETRNLFSRPVDRWDDPAHIPVPAKED